MDVVYPYIKSASRELEYSLKSLKHIAHDRVFVIGPNPDYPIDAQVIQPARNGWSRYSPYHDVINKLLTACELDDEIILMNDDIFLMSQNKIVTYNRGTLTDHMNSRRFDSYSRALRNTQRILRQGGYGDIDFELHTPMVMNTALLKIAITELLPHLKSSRALMIRSYYGNRFAVESEYMQDVKNPSNYKDLPILSTNEMTFAGEIGDYIREKL